MLLKLLDYGNPNPFGEIIGRRRKLAWPVYAYRITLPKTDKADGLNLFERTILKLIDAGGSREANAIAEETCLPKDLVQCILLRLRDKGLIDEHNEIISEKRDTWMTKREPEYITALLFKELATGKILPFLFQLDNNNKLKRKEKETKNYKSIRLDKNCMNNKPPEPRDVLRVLRKPTGVSGTSLQISIANEPERFYLDCPIAIQKNDSEFRIANPFGKGFSTLLESVFSNLLEHDEDMEKWYMKWKESLSNPNQNEDPKKPLEPFDNSANQAHYPNLVLNLRLVRATQYRSIEQIYSALEWALFYTCKQRDYDNAIWQLKFTDKTEHKELLEKAAINIGLDAQQVDFFPILEGKLDDFRSEEAEMPTVKAIALLMAEKDSSHPLHRIANQHPDFLNRLQKIKKKRDDQAHGKRKNRDVKLKEEDFMKEIVTSLLPDIHFSDKHDARINDDFLTDLILDARTNIQREFGFENFNRFGNVLSECLIQAEKFWLSCKEENDALAFVLALYSSLQAMFKEKLEGKLSDVKDAEFIDIAQKKAFGAKLGKLPKALSSVKPALIRETLNGSNETLGASAVAFLLMSDEDTLIGIHERQESFLNDIANIINKRGHGNKPLMMKREESGQLRKATYLTIKTLLEV